MENYHVLELIGEGSFGKVYKGRKRYSGQVVAMKFIPKTGRSEKELKNLRREIDIMRQLHHENIIQMLDSFETEKEVVAVTDYAEGELFQILEDDGQLPEAQVQLIACQLVSALFYLHSHRILHRDMKPQNILLGKGGAVKLCDFGFARAMSFNTLVLTSIKGTPLYMSPELVEEKPYDHTADLWALGCILYELFTGQPPFYTNSIFQLVSLIIKDPVRWPKQMTPAFKDFLQGLLTKTPSQRLAWPTLLHHPFVQHGVKVSAEDLELASPFTKSPTQSLILEREKQTREKAHPPGASKILTKAREKAKQQEATKKKKACERPEAWSGREPGEKGAAPPQHPDRPHTRQWGDTGLSMDPTPRTDRISQDYAAAYPAVEVGARRVLNRPHTMDNVKLPEDEADSDDEWQGLVETSDPEVDPDMPGALSKDADFVDRLRARLDSSVAQVLEGVLEGASRLRPVLRVVSNLLVGLTAPHLLAKFVAAIHCPAQLLALLRDMLAREAVRQQAWCQQILMDLVATLHAYLASHIPKVKDAACHAAYRDACEALMTLLPSLITLPQDTDFRLREQVVMCVIFLCEQLEKLGDISSDVTPCANDVTPRACDVTLAAEVSSAVERVALAEQVFVTLSGCGAAIEALLVGTGVEDAAVTRLQELEDEVRDTAQQRLEDVVCLHVAALAALTHIPVQAISGAAGKRRVAGVLAHTLTDPRLLLNTEGFLRLVHHPSTCSNVLKVVYSACQGSSALCQHLAADHHMQALLAILQGRVELSDMECNSSLETVIQLLNVLLLTLRAIPPDVQAATTFLISIFLESQLASHTAAAALLFSQLLQLGTQVEAPPDDLLAAALAEFTDLAQICVPVPLRLGVLDGLVLLLYQLLQQQGLVAVARLYIDTGVWPLLWRRVAQMLQVSDPGHDLARLSDLEAEGHEVATPAPDWSLLSFQGLLGVLQVATAVFTKETFLVMQSLCDPGGPIPQALMHLISPGFLKIMADSERDPAECLTNPTLIPCFEMSASGGNPAAEVLLQVTQLCCFPFALDASEEGIHTVQSSFLHHGLVAKVLSGARVYLRPDQLGLPMGLLGRLVLGDPAFVEQLAATCARQPEDVTFLRQCVMLDAELSVVCDTVSMCSHLVRTAHQHLALVCEVLNADAGKPGSFEERLGHPHAMVRARMCSLLGNAMKHNAHFYTTLCDRPGLVARLVAALSDDDPAVRKAACFALGNAAYHSHTLYTQLRPAISALVQLLDDGVIKTRCNAAAALGNLALHGDALATDLIQHKAILRLLETACYASQSGVAECALTALRSMALRPGLRADLRRHDALNKLSNMRPDSAVGSARPGSGARRSDTMVTLHSAKLIRQLTMADG